jgi:hypothetical protein
VVVDDVEDDLEAGLVERRHHLLELSDLLTAAAAGAVGRVRSEVAERVVTPVVDQPTPGQRRLGEEVVHRQQFHGGDAEVRQVPHDRWVCEAGVRAALMLWYVGVQFGEALGVQLVQDRPAPRHRPADRRWRLRPGDHHADRDVPGRVFAGVVEDPWTGEVQFAVDRPGVRVDQQLGRIRPQPLGRLERAVHPVSVPLAVADAGEEGGPHPAGSGPDQVGVALISRVIEQDEFDAIRGRRPQRELRAVGAHDRAEARRARFGDWFARGGCRVGHRPHSA